MEWPGIAALSCAECKKHLYTIPEGKLETYEVGDGERLPVERHPEMPTPCNLCPRGGPENEDRLTLSDRGFRAYSLYNRLQATLGAYQLDQKIAECPLFSENMWIIERTIRQAEAAIKARAFEEAEKERSGGL